MALRKDTIQLEIDISTREGVKQLAVLKQKLTEARAGAGEAAKEADKLSKKIEGFNRAERVATNPKWMKVSSEHDKAYLQWSKLTAQADAYAQAVENQTKKMGLAGMTSKELTAQLREQERALNGLLRGTKEYEEQARRVAGLRTEQATRREDVNKLRGIAGGRGGVGGLLQQVGPLALVGGGVAGVGMIAVDKLMDGISDGNVQRSVSWIKLSDAA